MMNLETAKVWRDNGNALSVVDWLIAECEALTAENIRIFAMVDAREQTIADLTALCDGYRGEVAALKAVEARVAHIKRSYAGGENWLRCLERAEKAESALTRARAEGMEDSAKIAETKAQGIREANTWRGKVNQYADQAALWLEDAAAEMRARAAQGEQ